MKDFLHRIIEGSSTEPPVACLETFNEKFKDALNPEWFKRENDIEAIFYRDNLEHIARFGMDGTLYGYRVNLSATHLPENIRKIITDKGEIMNVVLRNKGNAIEYEIVLRDDLKKRHLLVLSDTGQILLEKKL